MPYPVANGAFVAQRQCGNVIQRIALWEPSLKALYAYDPEGARIAAKESEGRWRRGEALPLDGVPCTIKENIATKGTAVPLGTAAMELSPAAADAPPAQRLREAADAEIIFSAEVKTLYSSCFAVDSVTETGSCASFAVIAARRSPPHFTKKQLGSASSLKTASYAAYDMIICPPR